MFQPFVKRHKPLEALNIHHFSCIICFWGFSTNGLPLQPFATVCNGFHYKLSLFMVLIVFQWKLQHSNQQTITPPMTIMDKPLKSRRSLSLSVVFPLSAPKLDISHSLIKVPPAVATMCLSRRGSERSGSELEKLWLLNICWCWCWNKNPPSVFCF